jgi:lipoprotein-releasing system ATP-binding protein
MSEPLVLQASSIHKAYGDGAQSLQVLRGVDFSLKAGEVVAIIGASGSGKSTLLHVLGGLDRPDSGQLLVVGQSVAQMSEAQLGQVRNEQLGFIYQFHHLLGEFSAQENVAMPLLIRRMPKGLALEKAQAVLSSVGLGHRLSHLPGQLSGGERQRVAVARALITEPKALLADEPTGNLDRETADAVFQVMLEQCLQRGLAILLVTHDLSLAKRAQRVLSLQNGGLVPCQL